MRGIKFSGIQDVIQWSRGFLNLTGPGTLREYIDQRANEAMPKIGGNFEGPVTLSQDALTARAPTTLSQVQRLISEGVGVDALRVYDFSGGAFTTTQFNNEVPPRTRVTLTMRQQDLPSISYPSGAVFGSGAVGSIVNAFGMVQNSIAQINGTRFVSPMTAAGDLIVGGAAGAATRLAIGTANQVLRVVNGVPTWTTPTSFANPMTASGDLIAGGANGAATRLAGGATGQVLTMLNGNPVWAAAQSGGFVNPMTANGDLIRGGASGAATRLAPGTAGQVLTMVSGAPAWTTLPASGGFTNPMTASGDLIAGGAGGSPTRVGIGSNGQVLTLVGGMPAWRDGGTGSGTGLTRIDRVLQTLISRANHSMNHNTFSNVTLSAANTPTVSSVPAVETVMTRTYSAVTGGIKPWQYLGGDAVVDGFGTRILTSQWLANQRIGLTGWIEFLLDGNEANISLEKNRQYRFLVEDGGVMKYVPDASVQLVLSGTGEQIYRLAFPNPTGPRVRRKIAIEVSNVGDTNQLPGRFGGIMVRKTDQVARTAAPQLRSLHVGDSNIQGVNGPHGASYSRVMAAHLGLTDHWMSANHSSGAARSDAQAFKWSQRRNDWITKSPDLLIFSLSWVDLGEAQVSGNTAVFNLIMTEITLARAALPDAMIVVCGLLWSLEGYASDPTVVPFNEGIKARVVALGDNYIRFMDLARYPETPLTGLGHAGAETGQGNADFYLGNDDHYSRIGDEWIGINTAQSLLEIVTDAYYRVPPAGAVASISPGSITLSLTQNVAVNQLLGTVANGTPTTASGGLPAGLSWQISGQQLRLVGTPSTVSTSQSYNASVATNNGTVPFVATLAVTAASVTPTINPTTANLTTTVNSATNQLLTTVSGGVPTAVTGSLPAGLSYVVSGQEIRVQGTPTTAAAQSARTATITVPGGPLTMNWNVTVAAAGGTATINPTAKGVVGVVGTPLNENLGEVSGGTPISVSGTTPAGLSWELAGAVLKITGTPTATQGGVPYTATVVTSNGNVQFIATFSIDAAVGVVIAPSSGTVAGVVGTAIDVLLGTVSGGTATSVSGTAPAGTSFVRSGQQLRLQGTPTTVSGSQVYTATVVTSAGNVMFAMTASVTAAVVASINPSAITQTSTVGQTRTNQILGQISNGTPTGIVSGTAPAGMSFSLSGQNLLMSGTYTTAGSNNVNVVVSTTSGNVTFNLNDTVQAQSGSSTVIADLKFDGTENQTGVMTNDATSGGLTFNTSSEFVALRAASAKTGATGLAQFGGAGQEGGVLSNQNVSLTGQFKMECDYRHDVVGYDYGAFMSIGTWESASFLTVEYSAGNIDIYREKTWTGGGSVEGLLDIKPYPSTNFDTFRHIVCERDASDMLTVKIDDVLILGPVLYAGTITGKLGLMTVDGNSFSTIYSSMDNFKLTIGGGSTPGVSISPSGVSLSGTVGNTVDVLLGTVSNGTPSGVTGTAPPGTTFSLSGQQLRLVGTYSGTTTAGQAFLATVATSAGPVTFNLAATIAAAPAPTISPTSLSVTGAVGTPINMLLGTVSNGIPNNITGTPPAGLSYVISGQQIRLQGTPTAATAGAQAFNLVIRCTVGSGNINVNFTMNANISSTGASPTIALLHMNEGTFPDRSATLINSATSGLTFSNVGGPDAEGGVSTPGGPFWSAGEGPFGQGVRTEAANGGTIAVFADQPVSLSKGFTHECFVDSFDDSGRSIWEISKDGTGDSSPYYIRVSARPGTVLGDFKIVVKHKTVAGVEIEEAVSTVDFTPNTESNWVVTQWTDDGHFEIYVNGVRVGVSAATYNDTFTDCVFSIFGSYDSVGHYTGGMFRTVVGEFRASTVQRYTYTGAPLTVPTTRFTS